LRTFVRGNIYSVTVIEKEKGMSVASSKTDELMIGDKKDISS